MGIAINQLVDMEWKLGVTTATNHIDKLGEPYLLLKFVYNKDGQLATKFAGMNSPILFLANLNFLLKLDSKCKQN